MKVAQIAPLYEAPSLYGGTERIVALSMLDEIHSCRHEFDPGTMAVVRSPDFLRALNQGCNIDPPTSSYAIMRRAGPYRGENSGPGKDYRGELDTETRN